MFAVIAMIGIIAALYFLREIFIPLAFALTFAFLFTPVVVLLEKARLGRALSVLLTMSVAVAGAAWAGWSIGNQFVEVINQLPTYQENIHAKIQSLSLSNKGPLARAATSVGDIAQELSALGPAPPASAAARQKQKRNAPMPVEMVEPSVSGFTYLRELSAAFLQPLALGGMVVVFTVFMLLKREDLRNRLLRLAGLAQLNVMTQALDDAAQRVSRYLLMQFLVNAGFGVVIGTGLYFIGVPNPAFWGVVAGLLRVVPYIGTLAAGAMPLFLALAVFNGWVQPVLVFLLFAILELLVGNLVEPWLYGQHTGISSLALLVTAVFWTVLWGPAGLILSTPLTVCVVVLGRYVPELSFLQVLLGDEPVLATEAQLYQRLLAMDSVEARSLVDLFLRSRPLIELYDLLLIPALNMAEHDRHRGVLDVTREEFLFLNVNEMVAEFCDYRPESKPNPSDRRILCVPAHDEADEITASMFAQILEHEGYATLAFPLGTSMQDRLGLLDVGPGDVICISSLPPYAFTPASRICKQLRSRFPHVTLIVGVWGYSGDPDKAKARFDRTHPEELVTSLQQALEVIQQLDFDPSTVVSEKSNEDN